MQLLYYNKYKYITQYIISYCGWLVGCKNNLQLCFFCHYFMHELNNKNRKTTPTFRIIAFHPIHIISI